MKTLGNSLIEIALKLLAQVNLSIDPRHAPHE